MPLLKIETRDKAQFLTLDDPDRRNILSGEMCAEIIAAVAAANADPDVHMLIVTGTPPAFCAGADLSDLCAAAEGETAPLNQIYRAFMAVADSPLPTLAAIDGPAVGAGFNLALACDWRIATPRSRFDSRFLKLGVHPGGGHAWMLLRAVGWDEACRMLLGDRAIDGAEAHRIGLIQQLSEPETLIDDALAFAAGPMATPRELLLRTKATLRLSTQVSHADAFAHETAEQLWSLTQPAAAKLLGSAQKDG